MLNISLKWTKPIQLKPGYSEGLVDGEYYDKRIPSQAGIYLLGRIHGAAFEVLYVGQAINLCKRVKGQLKNNVKLVHHLSTKTKTGTGKRVVVCGVLKSKQLIKTLNVAEGAFIRYYLARGDKLANTKGKRIRRHRIRSSRPSLKKDLPKWVFVEKLSKSSV